jgi:hypothetical protein
VLKIISTCYSPFAHCMCQYDILIEHMFIKSFINISSITCYIRIFLLSFLFTFRFSSKLYYLLSSCRISKISTNSEELEIISCCDDFRPLLNFCLFVNDLQWSLPTMEYPFTTIFAMSQDPVCSSTTVDIGADSLGTP